MSTIRRLVLDVLKPHTPTIIDFAKKLSSIKGIDGINCMVHEVDQETESIKITLAGTDINYDIVRRTIEDMGGVVHSIDMATAGKRVISDIEVSQDPT